MAEGGCAPADAVLNQFFRQRRFIGSKDRGEVSRVVYAVLRNEAALNWQLDQGGLPSDPRGRVLAEAVLLGGIGLEDMKALCDGQAYSPPRLSEPELGWIKQQADQPLLADAMPAAVRHHFPEWLMPRLETVFGDQLPDAMAALNEEASVDLRVNTLKSSRDEVLKTLQDAGLDPEPTPHSALGVRLHKRGALFATEAFRAGWFEMQDEGRNSWRLWCRRSPAIRALIFAPAPEARRWRYRPKWKTAAAFSRGIPPVNGSGK